MLGSLHDADDALQETLLRAWRGLPSYEPRAALSTWLHRIATNVALRMIEQRPPSAGVDAHLQPYPDRFLEELAAPDPSPEALAITREGVSLAFIAAMQLLPAKQRAVLALRDGLGWSARETAALLDDSTAAVNSALQRARERIAREHEEGTLARLHTPADAAAETAVMAEFLDAWAAVDVPRIVALLTDDALLTMPPMDVRFHGAAAIGEFFAAEPAQGRLERIKHVATRANGQPTLASYADEHDTGTHDAYGVMVFAIRGRPDRRHHRLPARSRDLHTARARAAPVIYNARAASSARRVSNAPAQRPRSRPSRSSSTAPGWPTIRYARHEAIDSSNNIVGVRRP